ncbi:nuclear transport factor 2 family protein [Marinicauda salina]|uniref:Nuclear transport factor 2 family protein n=1 Tax=Marinicauda salina TaxID=2135793 RepID=A0A2U2BT78_9PROT|nr:nuclear transport factor 2 family protein [Marinicauda salina]PWE17214.1 nuclear transport factor 2 family protein [Marinicauda salina]
MNGETRAFLAAWHEAVAARDASRMDAIIAEGCELHSPVVWKPSADKAYLIHILQGVIDIVEGFDYRREWVDGDEIILEFTGSVDGKDLVGIDRISLDDQGRMARLEVLIRPMNTLLAFAERMREHVLEYQPSSKESA